MQLQRHLKNKHFLHNRVFSSVQVFKPMLFTAAYELQDREEGFDSRAIVKQEESNGFGTGYEWRSVKQNEELTMRLNCNFK